MYLCLLMSKCLLFTVGCLLVITQMLAQTQGRVVVVADMETRRPIRDVLVYLDNGDEVKLDWTCRFRLYHHKFKRATFAHPDYLRRVMTSQELNVDTVFLIPLCQTLSEVVVTAKAPVVNSQIFQSVGEAVAGSAVKPSGRDFLSLLRPKDRKRKKLGQKTQEALENY